MKFNSIRFKISVLYTAILGAILIIYSSALYFSLYFTLYREFDDELKTKAQQIDNTIRSYLQVIGQGDEDFVFSIRRVITLEGEHPDKSRIEELESEWIKKVDRLGLRENYIIFLDSKGKSIVRSKNLSSEFLTVFSKKIKVNQQEAIFKEIKFKNRHLRIVSIPFSYNGLEKYIIQIGASVKPIIILLHNRLIFITVSIPAILIISMFIGRIFAVRILRPVKEVIATAENITHQNLDSRVETGHVDEEMKYLVDAFNKMISRLEQAFKYIAEFSQHVAHELKTPLAIIRGESEVTLRKVRSPEEYKQVLENNLIEVERILRTVEDLLLLTQLDYQRPEVKVFKYQQFDLVPFLKEIYEQSKMLASPKNIGIDIDMPEGPINIFGDRVHLRRLFFNLIHNAIKFNSVNGRIDIKAKSQDKKVVVSISDIGIGIKKEDLSKIFDKFFHVDRTGQENDPGNGLGLSIAQSIAKIHNGDIRVKSELKKGSIFTVTLPLR